MGRKQGERARGIEGDSRLDRYPFYWGARGDLARRRGFAEATAYYVRAVEHSRSRASARRTNASWRRYTRFDGAKRPRCHGRRRCPVFPSVIRLVANADCRRPYESTPWEQAASEENKTLVVTSSRLSKTRGSWSAGRVLPRRLVERNETVLPLGPGVEGYQKFLGICSRPSPTMS